MNHTPTTVLLVEDDPADAAAIQEALAGTVGRSFQVEWVTRLSDALARLGREPFEVILLDLTLPDGQGMEAFEQVCQAARDPDPGPERRDQ
jgi:DNA-binding response OmpR family regulator